MISQYGKQWGESLYYQNIYLQPIISTEPSPNSYRFALPYPLDFSYNHMG